MNKFYVHTFGCKVNQYESEKIRRELLLCGMREAKELKDAGLVILNTCTVTSRADADARNFIRLCSKNNSKVVLTGCYAQRAKEYLSKIDGVCCVVPQDQKQRIVENLLSAGLVLRISNARVDTLDGIKNHTRAFLKIQDGCNRFCTYCIVPYVRKELYSRNKNDVIKEAQGMINKNIKEIVLCGTHTGLYPHLSDVIEDIIKIEADFRVRLSSIEINEIDDKVLKIAVGNKKFCRHFHIPLQSGDNEILKKMARRYTRDFYLNRIKEIQQLCPDISVTTDVIVGFPSEKESAFHNTVSLIREANFLKVHIFPYSKREGTPASRFPEQLDCSIIKQRCRFLAKISRECSKKYLKNFRGKKVDVLIEKNKEGFSYGYSSNYIPVYVDKQCPANEFVRVRISEEYKNGVKGEIDETD
ncbi:tRNA (N(6)-L-threonylcarbamoyladenosine(37)-C(2))-methylthiotransferase MtaB [bacterium Unc6]|nr:tRNA (N(6)-L-threonylcarbamoyladenosine(37)-C(2))-methylthiotransferase MtaB [bacterium Unc6]